MINTNGEINKLFEKRTENETEIIRMYLDADAEARVIMIHVLKRLSEDPNCLDFAENWQGSAEELRTALAQI